VNQNRRTTMPFETFAAAESLPRCGPCSWCWEEPSQLTQEQREDKQPQGAPLYCRLLFNASTCLGPCAKSELLKQCQNEAHKVSVYFLCLRDGTLPPTKSWLRPPARTENCHVEASNLFCKNLYVFFLTFCPTEYNIVSRYDKAKPSVRMGRKANGSQRTYPSKTAGPPGENL